MYSSIKEAQDAVIKAVSDMVGSNLVTSTWGNVSAKVMNQDLIVITPSGIAYNKLKSDMLPVIDMNGNLVFGNLKPSSEKKLHITIYNSRNDIYSVMHTHSTYLSAMSVIRQPIPPIIEDMAQIVGGEIKVAQYHLPGTQALADNVVECLNESFGVIMANHGFVGIGRNADEAFNVCLVSEKAAQIYCIANSISTPYILSTEDVNIMRDNYLKHYSILDVGGNCSE